MTESGDWRAEPIQKHHQREAFDCGSQELNDYLKKYARQNEEKDLSRTFVALQGSDLRVWGYYTLRSGSVSIKDLPPEETKRFPRYPVPVVHLGRLATDVQVRGQGLGAHLLVDALHRAHRSSHEIAAYAVEAIAETEQARNFYLKVGFKGFLDDPLHLYLSMKTIVKVFGKG
jgi:GNAT superfamily N-acetyltransferase